MTSAIDSVMGYIKNNYIKLANYNYEQSRMIYIYELECVYFLSYHSLQFDVMTSSERKKRTSITVCSFGSSSVSMNRIFIDNLVVKKFRVQAVEMVYFDLKKN